MQSKLNLIVNREGVDKNRMFALLMYHINEVGLLECYRDLNRNKACDIERV